MLFRDLISQVASGMMANMAEFEMDSPESGGPWVRVHVEQDQYALLVQTTRRDGRRVINRVVIAGPEIDSGVLKRLPIGRIAADLNRRGEWPEVAPTPEEGGADHFLSKDVDRLLLADQAGSTVFVEEESTRPRLTRPDGKDPEGFYSAVGQAYREALATTSAPAVALAEEAGVPIATVRGWIREARRRSFLPPARKGRAG